MRGADAGAVTGQAGVVIDLRSGQRRGDRLGFRQRCCSWRRGRLFFARHVHFAERPYARGNGCLVLGTLAFENLLRAIGDFHREDENAQCDDGEYADNQ